MRSAPERPWISVVLPARNEAAIIDATIDRVAAFLDSTGRTYEIIVGDSGSEDETAAVAKARKEPPIRVVREELPGKGRILSRCLAVARGRYVGFLDADLEIPETALGDLLAALESGVDVAIATKVQAPGRPWHRQLITQATNALIRGLFGTSITDHQAGCKLFEAQALRSVLGRVQSTGWLWDTELLVYLVHTRRSIAEVPVPLMPSRPSRLSLGPIIRSFVELGRFRLRTLGERRYRRSGSSGLREDGPDPLKSTV